MSLNDDVEEGFGDATVPDYNPNLPIPDPIVIKVDKKIVEENKPVTAEDLFGSEIVDNEVPNLIATYESIKEKLIKGTDILYIKDTIVRAKGISKEDAELIQSTAGDFISETKPIGFFTNDKSPTQMNETVHELNKRIDFNIGDCSEETKRVSGEVADKLMPILKQLPVKVAEKTHDLQIKVASLAKLFKQQGLADSFEFTNSKTAFSILESNAFPEGRRRENCLDIDPLSPYDDDIKVGFTKYAKITSVLNSEFKLKALLGRALFGLDKDYICIGKRYRLYEITNDDSFFILADKNADDQIRHLVSLQDLISAATSGDAITAVNNNIGLCVNLITGVASSVAKVNEVISNNDTDQNSKLNELITIGGTNSRMTSAAVSVISLIEQYVLLLEALVEVLEFLTSKAK